MKKLFLLPMFFGFVFFLFPGLVSGQASTQPSTNTIRLQKSQQFPEPGDKFKVSVLSRLININDKSTTWKVDGETKRSGTGVLEVPVTAPPAGQTKTVTLQVVLPTRGVTEKSITISPTNLDLIWEPIFSWTPAFYKGKALHTGWGSVKVSVLPEVYRPDGGRFQSDELIYTWEYNDLVYGNDSGRGQDSFVVRGTPRDNRVTVEVETPGGEIVARETTDLPFVDPELLFYQQDPVRGIRLENSLAGEVTANQDSLSVTAAPYYFLSEGRPLSNLSFDWATTAGITQTSPNRITATESGRASLEVSDQNGLFPGAEADLEIILEE